VIINGEKVRIWKEGTVLVRWRQQMRRKIRIVGGAGTSELSAPRM
jgi:hypothetical protein